MNSLERIVVTDEIRDIIGSLTILHGTEEDLGVFTSYVELTRHLHEIYQWYDMFVYNYDTIKTLYPDGDLVAINSHTISLLSIGKNLIESAELCIGNSFVDENKSKDIFHKNVVAKEYDTNFSYRFLHRLRNFSQHGHIPVSRYSEFPCFDVVQIYDTPHFRFNTSLQNEAQKLIDEVAEKRKDNLTLAYRDTLCSYVCSVYKIYNSFLKHIQSALCEKTENCHKAIENDPQIAKHIEHPEFDGCVFYTLEGAEGNIHIFEMGDAPLDEHIKRLNDSVRRLKLENKDLKDRRKKSIPI